MNHLLVSKSKKIEVNQEVKKVIWSSTFNIKWFNILILNHLVLVLTNKQHLFVKNACILSHIHSVWYHNQMSSLLEPLYNIT